MSKTSTIGSAKSSMKRKNSIWHALPYIAPHFGDAAPASLPPPVLQAQAPW